MSRLLAAIGLAALTVSACGTRQAISQAARVDTLFADWNHRDSPGCEVGVSRNGAIVYEGAYGMADLELGVPMTPATVLPIASISKSFTAMSVLLAAKHGQLSLDDEIPKYIPEWMDKDDHLAIRHLITHTSGLRDAFTLLGYAPVFGDVNKGVVNILARQRGLNTPPGTEYSYNNGGYNLLASVLERATGQPLREFADANIFKPLGMTHSSYMGEPTTLMSGRASRYTKRADGWHRVLDPDGPTVRGNGGVYSTVGDLLLWTQNFDTARVGTPQLLTTMITPIVLKNGQAAPEHGTGIGLATYRGAPTAETSGGDYGMASKVTYFPKQHSAVAVICNEDNIVMGGMARANVDELAYRVADIYLADGLQPVTATPADAAPRPTKSVKLSDGELAEKTGLYNFSLGGVDVPVLMTVQNGRLMGRNYYGDGFDQELVPVDKNHFLLFGIVPFEFVPASGGRSKQWRVNQRTWNIVTFTVPAAELRSYAGRFHSDELDLTYAPDVDGSGLVLRGTYLNGAEVTIAPLSKDVFAGDLVGVVKFFRDSRGAVTAFTMSREATRGIRFDKVK